MINVIYVTNKDILPRIADTIDLQVELVKVILDKWKIVEVETTVIVEEEVIGIEIEIEIEEMIDETTEIVATADMIAGLLLARVVDID